MSVDEFGIKKIYPTNTFRNCARPWLLGIGDWKDRRFNGIGDWNDCPFENGVIEFGWLDNPDVEPPVLGPRKGRLPVLALRFRDYPLGEAGRLVVSESNQSRLRKRGFVGTINDWRNVEVTAYFKLIQAVSDSSYLQFTVRGGPHHSNSSPCHGGIGLCVSLTADGHVIIDKELEHPEASSGARTPDPVIANFKDKWIGMKSVVYNKVNGNPYIEFYLDRFANNTWELVRFPGEGDEKIDGKEDDGNWFLDPGDHNGCGGADNEKIIWGGSGVIFKIQGINCLHLKRVSVREILPPEGLPFRSLFGLRGISFPASVRSIAAKYGLTGHVSLRETMQLFQSDNS
jgi:hypothetical protein